MLKIAVPTYGGVFSTHFGGADRFAVFEVDDQAATIVSATSAAPPPHEQGSFPTWLHEQGCEVVLAGGMGPRAIQMLESFGIRTVIGVDGERPEAIVQAFLEDRLTSSGQSCHEHGLHHGCGQHGTR